MRHEDDKDIYELRAEIDELRAEAELRDEEVSGLQGQRADLHGQLARCDRRIDQLTIAVEGDKAAEKLLSMMHVLDTAKGIAERNSPALDLPGLIQTMIDILHRDYDPTKGVEL